MKINLAKFWIALPAFAAVFTLHVRAASVTAALDPAEITMGDSAQLTVTVSGAQEQPSVPNVDGLDITPIGQSTQIEVVNGSITANASFTYNITPQHGGTFVIPAMHAGGAASQPVTLHVINGSSSSSAPAQASPSGQGPVTQPPAATSSPDDTPVPAEQGKFGSLQLIVPKKEVYEGELIPVEVRATIPDDLQANISDLPQFTSDGFTLNSLSTKPERSEQIVNGRPCTVLSWHSAMTAVKSGDYPVSLQMPESVIVMQRLQQSNPDDDVFGDFFRHAFANMGAKKEVTLKTADTSLKVLPLPQANRPADFAGAVGQFQVEATASPTKVNAGDPITLSLKISGTGNFDRVSSDMLAADAHWKSYSTKSHFDANDTVNYQGTKTFEQPIIPNDASITAVPSLSFSFFDPEKRQYVTSTTPPIPVTVTGSSIAPAPSTPVATSPVATTAPTAPTPPPASSTPVSTDGLRANQLDPGFFVSTLRPIYLNPWFLAGQSLPLLALLCGLALVRRQELASHPQRTRATAAQQAIRQQINAMDEAMKNHQTDAFFVHARSALQQRLGQRWNLRPETITIAEIDARLGNESENIRPIFEMADQASYSDLQFEDADLRQWRQVVLNELAEKN